MLKNKFDHKQYLVSITWILFCSINFIHAQSSSKYKEVKIGRQVWMAENLNVERFRNGDMIRQVKSNEEWEAAGQKGKPAWCYYDNDPSNGVLYGKLYNWYAVNDRRGLAPAGWHVPSVEEYKQLTKKLGKDAGKKIKSATGWTSGGSVGSNSSGFSALPGGARAINDNSMFMDRLGLWWTSTKSGDSDLEYASYIRLDYSYDKVFFANDFRQFGLSVRCIRD